MGGPRYFQGGAATPGAPRADEMAQYLSTVCSKGIATCLVLATMGTPISGRAEDALWQALTSGKPDLYLRYRFEYVEDGKPSPKPLKNAYANTFRTALGYSTGLFYGFGLYGQFEDVRILGDQLFNDGSNPISDRATVVDPEGTDITQANIRYEGLPQTVLRLGRQEITHREAPLHRYIGNILWRQHWQMFDAFRVSNQSLPNFTADYAYVWNVKRIFGEDNPLPNRSEFRMDSHLLRLVYSGLPFAKLEGYGYLLDFNSNLPSDFSSTTTRVLSTKTFGARLEGGYGLTETAKVLYTAEIANQSDYANNPANIDVNYYLGELGATYTVSKILDAVSAKVSYEVLEGSGLDAKNRAIAFQTPLGTNHAFQGWAERFLVHPADGIKDLYFTFKAGVLGATVMAVYHDFHSDRDDYHYGTEWDFAVEKPFMKHFVAGLTYADYQADRNATNVARNSASGQAFDLTKLWAYLQFKF